MPSSPREQVPSSPREQEQALTSLQGLLASFQEQVLVLSFPQGLLASSPEQEEPVPVLSSPRERELSWLRGLRGLRPIEPIQGCYKPGQSGPISHLARVSQQKLIRPLSLRTMQQCRKVRALC